MTTPRQVTAIVLAFGAEPDLHDAVAAVLASRGVSVELLLVDNGCTTDAVATLPPDPRVRVIVPERNLGFTGGVNRAAAEATSPVLVLVNSDAVVEPGALLALAEALDDPGTGLVSGLVTLADAPGTVNSVGNPVHVLGLSWAGHMGEPAARHGVPTEIPSATGALMAARAGTWAELGGFPEEYFAYLEDLELSWRTWQRGLRVRYVPTARAVHHYEFSRTPLKMHLVERNRLLFLLTCYSARTLALLAVPLLAFEVAITLVALLQGWARQKATGWRWVLGHLGWVRARRRVVQAARTVPDRELSRLLTTRFDPAQLPLPPGGGLAQLVLAGYWRVARRFL